MKKYEVIPINRIKIPPNYPRTKFSKLNFRVKDMIYPILVDANYNLLDGKRRLERLKRKGAVRVPVIRILKNLNQTEQLEYQLITNLQREDLNAIDKARAFQNYLKLKGCSIREASKLLGIGKSSIEWHLRLLELPKEIQDRIHEGKLKPYSRELEKILRFRIRNEDDFKRASLENLFISVMRRLSALKSFIGKINFNDEQKAKIREKINELLKVV